MRAKRPEHLPVVLTRDEVRAVLQHLNGIPRLQALLFYGAGLRLLEAARLRVRGQQERDLKNGAGWVELPDALGRKYPNAGRQWGWQWVFPATRLYFHRETRQRRRHHLHESVPQRAVKEAVRGAGIARHAKCHTFRHSFATHVLNRGPAAVRSPADRMLGA